MAKLIITRGCPGSGKSYWSRNQEGFAVVEKDAIRKELEATGWKWSQTNEKDVIREEERLIRFYLENGNDVISASTNWGRHEERLKRLADSCGAEFAVRDFTDVPLETCLARNAGRPERERVPEKVINQMWNQNVAPLLKPKPVEWVNGLPTAVLVDLDGTLAIHNGRSPYDTEKCETDLLNRNVALVVQALRFYGHEIIFVSGREDKFRTQTAKWLTTHGFGHHKLFMRVTGDFRNDALVKNEIYDNNFRGVYNIVCCIDDRDRVVKRYREMGLTVLQCNFGNF